MVHNTMHRIWVVLVFKPTAQTKKTKKDRKKGEKERKEKKTTKTHYFVLLGTIHLTFFLCD